MKSIFSAEIDKKLWKQIRKKRPPYSQNSHTLLMEQIVCLLDLYKTILQIFFTLIVAYFAGCAWLVKASHSNESPLHPCYKLAFVAAITFIGLLTSAAFFIFDLKTTNWCKTVAVVLRFKPLIGHFSEMRIIALGFFFVVLVGAVIYLYVEFPYFRMIVDLLVNWILHYAPPQAS